MVDDVVGVEVLQPPEDLPGHPDNLKLPHGPAAVHLLQHRAPLARLHEEVEHLVPQQGAVQLRYVLVAELGLDLHIGRSEVLHRNLWCEGRGGGMLVMMRYERGIHLDSHTHV